MDTIELTKQLIQIPSFVNKNNNENEMSVYILKYIVENLPWLSITKQKVAKNRYNILAFPKGKMRLLFSSHMDTVKPTSSTQKMLTPIVKNGRLYGLGSNDMKAGLAASIMALKEYGKRGSAGLLFTCDEEYYFNGINRFMNSFDQKPDLIVFPEPTELQISNGSRGIVEIAFSVIGKSAHAGRPELGINAIEKAVEIVNELRSALKQLDDPKLGKTTVCLSSLDGGKLVDGKITVQANAIPDFANVLLDIRTASKAIDGKLVQNELIKIALRQNVTIANIKVNLDYKAYLITRTGLRKIEESIKGILGKFKYFEEFEKSGIGEATLIANRLNWNAINLGPVGKGTSHTQNEYVDISSVEKLEKIFINLISRYSEEK